jgi:putative peptide zinc metalloprotease protein
MDPAVADVVGALDGTSSVAEVAARLDLDVDDTVEAVGALREAGVLEGGSVDLYASVDDRLRSHRTRAGARLWRAVRQQTLVVPGTDRIAGAVDRAIGSELFSAPAAAAGAVIALVGVVAFSAILRRSHVDLASPVSGGDAAFIVVALLVAAALHEFGHALAVKHAGRRVNGAGFQLYLGHPVFYVDSTDLLFGTRRQRALNAVVGVSIEAVLAGAASLAVWRFPTASYADALARVAALMYLSVGLNLIPFIELDGYWLLTDLLDTPRLRARSFALMRTHLVARLRGRRGAFTTRERWMLAFGVFGIVFTVAAVATAWFFWWPVVSSIVGALAASGWLGIGFLCLAAVVIIGPALGAAVRPALALAGAVMRLAGAARFRLQTHWRVDAAKAIARLHPDADLDDDTLSDLAGRVRRRVVRAGETVVSLGDGGHDWFVVRKGRMEVVGRGGGVLVILTAGDAFGERALLQRGPHTASVRAIIRSEVFVLDGGAYLRTVARRTSAAAGSA